MAKLVDGVVTEKYLWQDLTTLLAVYDANDNVKQRFEYSLSHTPVSFTQSGQRYYIQTDHLGSPRVISSATGTVIKTLSYNSYGNVIEDSNPSFSIPFGFSGGLQDSDTGLVRFGYRDYDPETGRWTARDPIGFAGGDTNLYGYVLGDPVNFYDPDGLISIKFDAYLGIGGGITFGYDRQTGKLFYGGRVGVGVGAGLNIDPNDRGPLGIARKENPYGDVNPGLKAGDSGFVAGGDINVGLSLFKYENGFGASGGRFFDCTNNSFSQEFGFSSSFNAAGGQGKKANPLKVSIGASATIGVYGWH